jgi:hypothetical protein
MSAHEPFDDDLLASLGYTPRLRCEILVDPCVALDVLGLWITTRVVYSAEDGPRFEELDVHIPADQEDRHVELGHEQLAHRLLGQHAHTRVLAAVDAAMMRPMQLVVELNGSTHGVELMLEKSGRPKLWALGSLARMVDATHHEMVESVLAFRIPDPRPEYLQILARVFFGEAGAGLFEPR